MLVKSIGLGIFMLMVAPQILPSKALADYTCWNPAICIAVCGSETCVDSARQVNNVTSLKAVSTEVLQRELQTAPRNSPIRDATSALLQSRGSRSSYTCWNPAICIAVCGSKTCGE